MNPTREWTPSTQAEINKAAYWQDLARQVPLPDGWDVQVTTGADIIDGQRIPSWRLHVEAPHNHVIAASWQTLWEDHPDEMIPLMVRSCAHGVLEQIWNPA